MPGARRAERGPVRPLSRTGVRIGGAFGAVLLVFGLALLMTLLTLDQMAEAEHEVARLDHAKHAGHRAETQVREQYIHQAHLIIGSGPEHGDHYERAAAETRQRTAGLIQFAQTEAERRLAEQIAISARTIDDEYRQKIKPALAAGDRAKVLEVHAGIVGLVARVGEENRKLSASFEERSSRARSRAHTLRARAKLITIACCLAAIVVAALLGVLLMRSIVRPIDVLIVGTQKIGAGDLAHRIDWPGQDEFAELAGAFNRMTSELKAQQEKRIEAERLAVLGQVAAGVAHEINNPIGVILGYLKLMKRDEGRSVERLAIIEDEAKQCHRIVQDLLDIARTAEIEPTETDICKLVEHEIARLEESGKLAGREVVMDVPSQPIMLWVDGGRVRQVVANLLKNSVEATTTGDLISVNLKAAADGALIEVKDAGTGLSADVRPRAFDAFFTTKAQGTGLGLAICRAIVEAHGGRIEFASRDSGGAHVSVTLPRREALA